MSEIPNIGLSGFAFFLLIICVGYVFVESLGEKYNHKYVADTTFERGIQYVIWGILSQLTTIYILVKSSESTNMLSYFLDSTAAFAQTMPEPHQLNVQLFVIIIMYFVSSLSTAIIQGFLIRRITGFISSHSDTLLGKLFSVLPSFPTSMLHLYKLMKKVTSTFTMLDRTIVKIDLVVIGLLLAKLFPVLTSPHRGRYVAVIILAEIYFIIKITK